MATRQSTKYIVIHCSATKPSMDIGAAWIDAEHKKRGWSGIGYHKVITRSGAVEDGREIQDVGAHTKGHNFESVGVCMVGGINEKTGEPEDNFEPAQYRALRRQVDALLQEFPDAKVLGHRDLSPDIDGDGVIERHEWLKACPCFDAVAWFYCKKIEES